jgi:hypothetical protein
MDKNTHPQMFNWRIYNFKQTKQYYQTKGKLFKCTYTNKHLVIRRFIF